MNTGLQRNPYDTFFREAFGTPESARELAVNLVPSRYREPLLTASAPSIVSRCFRPRSR